MPSTKINTNILNLLKYSTPIRSWTIPKNDKILRIFFKNSKNNWLLVKTNNLSSYLLLNLCFIINLLLIFLFLAKNTHFLRKMQKSKKNDFFKTYLRGPSTLEHSLELWRVKTVNFNDILFKFCMFSSKLIILRYQKKNSKI